MRSFIPGLAILALGAGTVRGLGIAVSAVLFAPLAAHAAEAVAPSLLNLEEVFSPDDYPASSARKREQGTAHVDVVVDTEGLVKTCRVSRSSGHAALDEQTCALLRARARFAPARDRRGRFVEGRYSRPVTWRLEEGEEPLFARQAWFQRFISRVNADGKIVGCAMETIGTPKLPDPCPQFAQSPEFERLSSAERVAVAEGIIEVQFTPEDPARARPPAERGDATRVGRQVLRLEVEADGDIASCEVIEAIGNAGDESDLCRSSPRPRFTPQPGAATLTGTVFVTAYLVNLKVS